MRVCNKSMRLQALQQIPPCLLSSPDFRPSASCGVSQINARQPAAIGQTKQVNTKRRLCPHWKSCRKLADLHHYNLIRRLSHSVQQLINGGVPVRVGFAGGLDQNSVCCQKYGIKATCLGTCRLPLPMISGWFREESLR